MTSFIIESGGVGFGGSAAKTNPLTECSLSLRGAAVWR